MLRPKLELQAANFLNTTINTSNEFSFRLGNDHNHVACTSAQCTRGAELSLWWCHPRLPPQFWLTIPELVWLESDRGLSLVPKNIPPATEAAFHYPRERRPDLQTRHCRQQITHRNWQMAGCWKFLEIEAYIRPWRALHRPCLHKQWTGGVEARRLLSSIHQVQSKKRMHLEG